MPVASGAVMVAKVRGATAADLHRQYEDLEPLRGVWGSDPDRWLEEIRGTGTRPSAPAVEEVGAGAFVADSAPIIYRVERGADPGLVAACDPLFDAVEDDRLGCLVRTVTVAELQVRAGPCTGGLVISLLELMPVDGLQATTRLVSEPRESLERFDQNRRGIEGHDPVVLDVANVGHAPSSMDHIGNQLVLPRSPEIVTSNSLIVAAP